MVELNGRVAIITGAASGFGRELAKACAAHGMRVVLADLREAGLVETAALLPPDVDCMTAVCDVSDAAAVDRLADEAYERFGNVEVLFNNAGIFTAGSVWKSTPAEWHRVMSVNVMGVANGVRSFVPRMLESGRAAHIVNTASLAGLVSTPGFSVYTASKHAVVALTECLYQELVDAKSLIGVSLLCPAWVSTGLADRGALAVTSAEEKDAHGNDALERARMAMGASRVTAADIAAMALTAVKENRFYVITHKKSLSSVQLKDGGHLGWAFADRLSALMATKTEIVEFLARELPKGKCRVQEVGNASATVTHDIGPDELRPGQTVFGPVLMTVADLAIYVALLGEIGIVPLAVTTNLTINFMRKPSAGRRIVGVCKLLKVGKRQAVGEVLLYSEGAPEIVAHSVGTYSIPSMR